MNANAKRLALVFSMFFAFTAATASAAGKRAKGDKGDKGDKTAKATPAAEVTKDAPKEAAKPAAVGKDLTLAGEMMCAKCTLNEADKCGNVLKVTKDGKDTKYYLTQNDVAKSNHSKVCSSTVKATVKGTVAEEAGKHVLTASEIKYE